MKYQLTDHAQTVVSQRRIRPEWLERIIDNPVRIEPHAQDGNLEHRLGVIEEHGGRVLRIIVNKATDPIRVVIAYFDRTMRNKI